MSQTNVNTGEGVLSSQVTLYEKTPEIQYGNTSSWSRRTKLERRLVYLVLLCSALSAGLIIAFIVTNSKGSDTTGLGMENQEEGMADKEPQQTVCTSMDCVITAARVGERIDFSVDPCEDFYTFACGSWNAKIIIPEDRSAVDQISNIRDDVKVILKNILEDNEAYADVEVLRKPKTLYSSCLALDKIEEVGDAPLRALHHSLGGWPLVEQTWTSNDFSLTDRLVQMSVLGTNPLFDFSVHTDIKNSTARILSVDQPYLGMPGRKYYLVPRNDSNVQAYQTLILNVATELGADPSTVEQDVWAIVDFEIQLANISVSDEIRRTMDLDELYNLYTLPEMAQNFSGAINWTSFFHQVFNHPDVGVTLQPEEPLVNWSPDYFSRFVELLDVTPIRTVANYMIWRGTMNTVSYLSEKYRNFYQDYIKVLWGISKPSPRYQDCVFYTTNTMGLAVGHMFVAKAFDESAKAMVLEMIVELKKAFNEQLDELDWMDEETKSAAREKAKYIDEKIGYPVEVLNITYLTQLYESLSFEADDYFNNMMAVVEYWVRFQLRQLREPVNKHQWTSPPSTVNAFYSATKNQIMFPAGILQPPFFSKTYPQSLNFGCIGVVIGHEITHGFDDRGRAFDKDGNLRQWWSEEAIRRFKQQAQCIIHQYGNFTVPEANLNLNGVKTQGENIADNGAVRQSFRAYRNWVREKRGGKEEELLPGLDFTHDQLFFLGLAQVWCGKIRKESAVQSVRTGVHSPGRFRVIGPSQNSEDFAKAFNCAQGSYMNPANKCIVW